MYCLKTEEHFDFFSLAANLFILVMLIFQEIMLTSLRKHFWLHTDFQVMAYAA